MRALPVIWKARIVGAAERGEHRMGAADDTQQVEQRVVVEPSGGGFTGVRLEPAEKLGGDSPPPAFPPDDLDRAHELRLPVYKTGVPALNHSRAWFSKFPRRSAHK